MIYFTSIRSHIVNLSTLIDSHFSIRSICFKDISSGMAIFFLPDHLLNESSNVKNTYMVGYLDSVLSILRSDIKVYERYEIINKYYFFMTRRTYNNLIKAYNERWSDLHK